MARDNHAHNPRSSQAQSTLAVVTSYFNPDGSPKRASNLTLMKSAMDTWAIPFYVVELALADQQPSLADDPQTLVLRSRDLLWQKERLLNLAIARLPAHYDKIAWIDADVLFPDPSWYSSACRLLESHSLLQLFDRVLYADPTGKCARARFGAARQVGFGMNPLQLDLAHAHPGLAWAARRDFIIKHGLFDQMIVGGGDTMLALAAYGAWDHWHVRALPRALRNSWAKWAHPFHADLAGEIGWLPTTAVHLWHGDEATRRYVDRLSILRNSDFAPAADLRLDASSLWTWASRKRALQISVANYVRDRLVPDYAT